MLVYADHTRPGDARVLVPPLQARLDALAAARVIDDDALVSALIDLGTLESGMTDALCPDGDGWHDTVAALRRASEAVGLAVASAARATGHTAAALAAAVTALRTIDPAVLPSRIELRTPEGYAFYALYPDAYVDAALHWAAEHRHASVVCLGLRSIGTSLSAAVHGALTLAGLQASSWTVRPRGHPFDRRSSLDLSLTRRWHLERDVFVIVDEGPGLSGSSVAGTAAALAALGVPDDRIVLLVAWQPDVAQLRSAQARARWPRHRVLTAGFERVRHRVLAAAQLGTDAVDLSAGRWRNVLACAEPWPPSQPQHERLKFLTGDGRLVRFAGLGTHGELRRLRAERLAAAGWTPAPGLLRRGWLALRFEPGATPRAYDAGLVEHAARYVGWLRRHATTGAAADSHPLAEMLIVNTREGLGDRAAATAEALAAGALAFAEPAVAVDGRLLPHEWIRTPGGYVKTDALDHHDDHFLPGATDAAWDVAGLIVEGGLDGASRDACIATYVRASDDGTILRRLPFHVAAYAAFRLGYCTMAEPLVDGVERSRFAAARRRYAAALRAALAAHGAPEQPGPTDSV